MLHSVVDTCQIQALAHDPFPLILLGFVTLEQVAQLFDALVFKIEIKTFAVGELLWHCILAPQQLVYKLEVSRLWLVCFSVANLEE
jgi:hypothetical protein